MIKVHKLREWLSDKPDDGDIDILAELSLTQTTNSEGVWLLSVSNDMIEDRLKL